MNMESQSQTLQSSLSTFASAPCFSNSWQRLNILISYYCFIQRRQLKVLLVFGKLTVHETWICVDHQKMYMLTSLFTLNHSWSTWPVTSRITQEAVTQIKLLLLLLSTGTNGQNLKKLKEAYRAPDQQGSASLRASLAPFPWPNRSPSKKPPLLNHFNCALHLFTCHRNPPNSRSFDPTADSLLKGRVPYRVKEHEAVESCNIIAGILRVLPGNETTSIMKGLNHSAFL